VTAREWTSLVVFALATGGFYLILVEPPQRFLTPLAASARATSGTITRVDWNNHGTRTYEYVVEGVRYTADTLNGPTALGTAVTVYYLPARPGHSVIGAPPRAQLNRLRRGRWICAVYGAVLALLVWWRFSEATQRLTGVYDGSLRNRKEAS
jgi:hypothetical protein